MKIPPPTFNRYEVCIGGGGWTDTSFGNIEALVATNGTCATSILYRILSGLKNAVPGIDAIDDDDEQLGRFRRRNSHQSDDYAHQHSQLQRLLSDDLSINCNTGNKTILFK